MTEQPNGRQRRLAAKKAEAGRPKGGVDLTEGWGRLHAAKGCNGAVVRPVPDCDLPLSAPLFEGVGRRSDVPRSRHKPPFIVYYRWRYLNEPIRLGSVPLRATLD